MSSLDFAPLTTAINNPYESTVKVYPNPVRDQLIIETSGAYHTVAVIDLAGNVLKMLDCRGAANVYIDMGQLELGMYIVKLEGTDGMVMEKVIKQ